MAGRLHRGVLLLFADLDNMKIINDTLGHRAGDQALIDTGTLIKDTFRSPDIIARIGGDEFVILALEGATETSARWLMARLQRNIDAHNKKGNRPYTIALCIGVVRFDPKNPCLIEDLLTEADKEMYEEKKAKKLIGLNKGLHALSM